MYPHQHPLDTASDVIVELQRTFYEDVGGGGGNTFMGDPSSLYFQNF